MKPDSTTSLVYRRRHRIWGRVILRLLRLLGIEIPYEVEIGPGFMLFHGGFGVVIHPLTRIGANVHIFHGVTLGRADPFRSMERSKFEGFVIEDGVMIGAGAVVLCKEGVLTLGRNSLVGANSLLLQSTGENEIWVGNPARCVGHRSPEDFNR